MIGGIEEIAGSVDVLGQQSASILSGIAGLKGVTMVAAGFSGLAVAALAGQFLYLNKRFNGLQKEIQKVQEKQDDSKEAHLKSSLDYLKQAEAANGTRQVQYNDEAMKHAREAGHFFSSQAVKESIHGNDARLVHFYARKYFLALSSELSALLGNDCARDVLSRLETEDGTLKEIARQVYSTTIGGKLVDLMAPGLEDVASLELMKHLYRQAWELGCLESMNGKFDFNAMLDSHRPDIFAFGRTRIRGAGFGTTRVKAEENVRIAAGAFEEIQRLQSWGMIVRKCVDSGGGSVGELKQKLEEAIKDMAKKEAGFMAYSF